MNEKPPLERVDLTPRAPASPGPQPTAAPGAAISRLASNLGNNVMSRWHENPQEHRHGRPVHGSGEGRHGGGGPDTPEKLSREFSRLGRETHRDYQQAIDAVTRSGPAAARALAEEFAEDSNGVVSVARRVKRGWPDHGRAASDEADNADRILKTTMLKLGDEMYTADAMQRDQAGVQVHLLTAMGLTAAIPPREDAASRDEATSAGMARAVQRRGG